MRAPDVAMAATSVPPGRWQGLLFQAKACAFRWRRTLRDLSDGPRRQIQAGNLRVAPVLAEFRSDLWPTDETATHLVAGKIHNLRKAMRSLDGMEVPAGEVFSFWKQTGRARRWRGYVTGRELREGCIVPAIGGGLCQLSSGLYDSAVRAGLEVVERHRHSLLVPGSLAESDRDATVFWNYLDLRLRAPWPWRLEVRMDARVLHIRIRASAPPAPVAVPLAPTLRAPVSVGDCSSCDETDCHQYEGQQAFTTGRTWLVEDDWPEFKTYRETEARAQDRVLDLSPRLDARGRLVSTWAKVVRRWLLWRGKPLPQARLGAHELLAASYAKRLRFDDLHLVVPQALLPFLWKAGELNGRVFDVLMTALPMHEIQARLDQAAALHPTSPTLSDFRADPEMVEAERQSLLQARRWITPHAEILRIAGARALPLPWSVPASPAVQPGKAGDRLRVLLPASSLARKGAIELREALRGLCIELLLPAGAEDGPGFWRGFEVARVASLKHGVDLADVVVLPAWIEHQPRGLLWAIAGGKPVIATAACGLPEELPWVRVAEGDVQALRGHMMRFLAGAGP